MVDFLLYVRFIYCQLDCIPRWRKSCLEFVEAMHRRYLPARDAAQRSKLPCAVMRYNFPARDAAQKSKFPYAVMRCKLLAVKDGA